MINNYFILKAQANYLDKSAQGFFINDIFTFDKEQIALSLSKGNSEYFLIISFRKDFESLYLDENFIPPKNNLFYFFESLTGAKICNISVLNKNRCLRIDFEIHSLYISFIPNKLNLFLTQKNIIIDSFKTKKLFINQNISKVLNFRKETNDESNSGDLESYIKTNSKIFGKIYLNKFLEHIKSDKLDLKNVHKIVLDFENNLINSKKLYIFKSNDLFIPSLINISNLQQIEIFNDVNSLIKYYLRNIYRLINNFSSKTDLKQRLFDKKESTESKIENLKKELSKAQIFNIHKLFGDILLTEINNIKYGDKVYVAIVNNEKHIIKLDEKLSVVENANKYYNKYKGFKKSVIIINEKINSLLSELDKINEELSAFNDDMNYKELKKVMKASEIQKEKEELPFRIFKLDDTYEVWVGKSSASNDLLTTKYTNQYELWFHVRGSSGSHTVLKFTDKNQKPTKDTISIAASIAAYYSKAKNAKNVPVAYTEKRNVKKKKGFKEGSVVMEKEKVIFVNPKLPV